MTNRERSAFRHLVGVEIEGGKPGRLPRPLWRATIGREQTSCRRSVMARQNERQQLYRQNWEIITNALSCWAAGSLFLIFFVSLPLSAPTNYLVLIISLLLLLLTPVLFIFTYHKSLISKAKVLLNVVRPVLCTAVILSIWAAAAKLIPLFGLNSWQALAYLIYMLIIFVLFSIACFFPGKR